MKPTVLIISHEIFDVDYCDYSYLSYSGCSQCVCVSVVYNGAKQKSVQIDERIAYVWVFPFFFSISCCYCGSVGWNQVNNFANYDGKATKKELYSTAGCTERNQTKWMEEKQTENIIYFAWMKWSGCIETIFSTKKEKNNSNKKRSSLWLTVSRLFGVVRSLCRWLCAEYVFMVNVFVCDETA